MSNKQSSVEWLAEKYNYVTWMRNRDEISAGTADEWRKKYLEQAKEMHKQETMDAWYNGFEEIRPYVDHSEDYYNETYKQD
jgi:hypothetical protein